MLKKETLTVALVPGTSQKGSLIPSQETKTEVEKTKAEEILIKKDGQFQTATWIIGTSALENEHIRNPSQMPQSSHYPQPHEDHL